MRVHERGSWKPAQTGWPQLTPAVQSAGCLRIDCFLFERGSRSYNLGAVPRVTQAALLSLSTLNDPGNLSQCIHACFMHHDDQVRPLAQMLYATLVPSQGWCAGGSPESACAQQDVGQVRDSGSVEDTVASAILKMVL